VLCHYKQLLNCIIGTEEEEEEEEEEEKEAKL
jgi:hypothetical protein